jgi:16S rRNA (cytidine1402-2'-O)-methyltransferase
MLYLVSVPIGNLDDITLRALKVLANADLILAEDTRRARKLLAQHRITKKILSFHDFNKRKRTKEVLNFAFKQQGDVALIPEAGTPLISDPGFYLLKRWLKKGLPYTAIPGPCSVINALVLSGLAPDRFFFAGFLNAKSSKRKKELRELAKVKTTLIVFESRYRILRTAKDIGDIFVDKEVVVAREMTKMHQEIIRAHAQALAAELKTKTLKGEFVVIIDNR